MGVPPVRADLARLVNRDVVFKITAGRYTAAASRSAYDVGRNVNGINGPLRDADGAVHPC
jgi:hypothetical protein